MWRISWFSNEHFLNSLVCCFYFRMQVRHFQKRDRRDISLQRHYPFPFILLCNISPLPVDLLSVTLFVRVCVFLTILLPDVTFFNDVSIFFAVCTVLVLFYLCTISSIVHIFTTVLAHYLDLTYVKRLL